MNRVPTQIVLNVIETGGLELVIEFPIEHRFGYIECIFPLKPGLLKVHAPVETRRKPLQLLEINFVETNPIPVKAAMALMGLLEPVWRLPLVAPSAVNQEKIRGILEALGLAEKVHAAVKN